MRRPERGAVVRRAPVVVVVLASLALPPALTSKQLSVFILLGLAVLVTLGLSLLMGYAGQVSLGQASFSCIGGYTAGLLSVHGVPSVAGLLAAPVVAALFAGVVGIPLLRLRGHALAFATLAMQLILLSLLSQADWAGGAIGLQGVPRLSIGGLELAEDLSYAYLTWFAVAVAMVLAHNIITSRAGRGLRALASSESAAAACGVPVGRYRLAVFALSAAIAGLAGGIYAFYVGYLSPGSFPVLMSIEYVVMAVVGGLGTLWGPVLGATGMVLLVQVLNTLGTRPGMPSYAPSVLQYAVYAGLLVLVLLLLPRGIVPALRDLGPMSRRAVADRRAVAASGVPDRVGENA
ncbi:branched-chain amino acid ABC transporter permease [Plantactinospora solaniradicis]|uniref:Branched-chain amino acid ABC transporter permease n=1 Tax=Plantactinospora solaniradicis TaxID=1723736 RepID=A0ABW1K5C8_9ACTN